MIAPYGFYGSVSNSENASNGTSGTPSPTKAKSNVARL